MIRIYLDQNKFIELARIFYGKNSSEESEELLNKIVNAVNESEIIVPLSGIHIYETLKSVDKGRRKRLSTFMYHLSKGHYMLPVHSVRDFEIENSIMKRIDTTKTQHDIHYLAVAKNNLVYALGSELIIPEKFKEYEEDLREKLDSEEMFVSIFSEIQDNEYIIQAQNEDKHVTTIFEENRKKLFENHNKDDAYSFVSFDIINSIFLPRLMEILKKEKIDSKQFTDTYLTNKIDIFSFFNDMPTFEIWNKLFFAREWDLSRPIDKNDTYDIGFLSMAIPYCDIVIAEKYFINKVKELKLDAKYGTKVSTNLNSILDYI